MRCIEPFFQVIICGKCIPNEYFPIRGIADKFKPDLVMISAGFDSRENDPLGHFTLTDGNFATLTRRLMEFADAHCQGRLVSVLEGGYRLSGLASVVTSHVSELVK